MVAPDEALFGKKYQGVEKRSTGYKLLAAMGWKEGEGLGAAKQGIKEHVRVRKKADTIGVGLKEAAEHSKDWKIGMVAFDHVLSALKEVRAQHDKDQRGQHAADSDSSSSDEDGEAPAAQPPKKKARTQQAAQPSAKKAGANSSKKAHKRAAAGEAGLSGGEAGSRKKQKVSKETVEAAAAAAAAAAKNPTHLGRFARREAGKRVKGYSATDLAAILGGGASEAPAAAAPAAAPSQLPQAAAQDAPSSGASEETALEVEDDAGSSQPQEDDSGKWWTKAFSRAGRMGSRPMEVKDAPKPKVNVHGFSEQDQVDLYSLTQGGASKSKQGLGQGSAPKKVAGARWEGTKMRIGDSDSEPEQPEAVAEAAPEPDADAPEMGTSQEKHVILQPKSKQQAVAVAVVSRKKGKLKGPPAAVNAISGEKASAADKVKWKKVCRQLLSAEPGQKLSHKKLLKKAASTAGLAGPPAMDDLLSKLQHSSQFVVTPKHVTLT